MISLIKQNSALAPLRAIFIAAGFDLWFVGGCVRDTISGETPKDIDLATSATPEEQVEIYTRNNMRFIPTGLQHGTVTVMIDQEGYEITSLRTESQHDGRYAVMAYTRDLTEDLSRRDLTINAMALDFDGNLIDPFGGEADLKAGRVRFVGNAEERMREDYLRILRFFRFHARFAGDTPLDEEAHAAIRTTRGGLSQISVERVWSEMQKIVCGPAAEATLDRMREVALIEIIGMPYGVLSEVSRAQQCGVTHPASVMGTYVGDTDLVDSLASQWKWSTEERERARFVASKQAGSWKEFLVDGRPSDWVVDLMRLQEFDPNELVVWEVPKMPVTGADLIRAGVSPGPSMGTVLREMKSRWVASDFSLTREELMGGITNV